MQLCCLEPAFSCFHRKLCFLLVLPSSTQTTLWLAKLKALDVLIWSITQQRLTWFPCPSAPSRPSAAVPTDEGCSDTFKNNNMYICMPDGVETAPLGIAWQGHGPQT